MTGLVLCRFGGGAPGGFGGQAGGNGKGGSPPSAEEIEKRKKQMLEHTTPEERAMRDQYRREMNLRRQQRGLPAILGGRRVCSKRPLLKSDPGHYSKPR